MLHLKARMNIGFATQTSLPLLRHLVANGERLPEDYQFAPSADWVKELLRMGHNVTVFTTAAGVGEATTFRGNRLKIKVANRRRKGTGRDFYAAERQQLTQMMLEERCEIIHAHWTYEYALAALATGIPTLVTIHDLPWNVLRYFRDAHRAARLVMAYEVAFRGKHFTAVSDDAAKHFRRYLKPGAKIAVAPNGLPDAIFEMGKGQLRAGQADVFTFATVLQGWTRRKNPTAALKAFAIVRRELPAARLLMFGLGYQVGGPAHDWAVQQNIENGVTFAGVLPYMQLIKKLCEEVDVLVHPSVEESFSMAALEGMALRKPVIAGRSTPGVRQVLGFGEAGILVDVRDPAALAEAMIQLARNPEYLTRVAESGYERASKLYRLEAVMTQYQELYKRILGSSAC